MADAKISAFPTVSSPADADLIPIVDAGATKAISLTNLTAYFEQRGRQTNASVAQQTFAATDAYVTGSDVLIPNTRVQAKTMYRARMEITKTSTTSSVSTPIVSIRIGTAATTADTARATLTFAAQTAVADTGFLEIFVTFRTVGSGTTAVISATGILDHVLAATGLSTANVSVAKAVSSGFDSTVSNLRIGWSFNGGTSWAGTTNMVQAELFNLA